ncbi:MAG: flagellar filament capping protein FliD [Velocimicrobium sp.]
MGIKLSGMISGLDTDSIVKELMSAQSLKKKKVENTKTELNWSQEIWKDLNSKLLTFYKGTLTKAKSQGSYNTKKVTSSDEALATATAKISAPKGAHTLEVTTLASAQYLTSGEIKNGGTVSSATTLTSLGIDANTVITIQAAKTSSTTDNSNIQKLTVGGTTTISDFVSACQKAGLNANFDATQKRLFISSENSGTDQQFSITTTAVSSGLSADFATLKELTGYNDSTTTTEQKAELDNCYSVLASADSASTEYQNAYDKLVTYAENNSTADYATKYDAAKSSYQDSLIKDAYKAQATSLLAGTVYEDETNSDDWLASAEGQQWVVDNDWTTDNIAANPGGYATALQDAYAGAYKAAYDTEYAKVESDASYTSFRETVASNVTTTMTAIEAGVDTANDYNVVGGTAADIVTAIETIKQNAGLESTISAQVVADKTLLDSTIPSYITNSEELPAGQTADGNSLLTKIGLAEITGATDVSATTAGNVSGLTLVTAKDAKFTLDGAQMEETSNNFTVNNITFDLKGTTTPGNPLKVTIENDMDSVYNMVKSFVKEFNSVLDKMNDLYYAGTAKGYTPLTSEQKDAMTDDEVEKWETKIKDSLLRRDTTLGSLTTAMKTSLMQQIKINGKDYSLASFGIHTSNDFSEKGLLHIYGDSEDDTYSTDDNDLKALLESDPDLVMQGLSTITSSLYDTMKDKMGKTKLSSSLTFYNDVQMKKWDSDYKEDIDEWEDKLADMEERYYNQFTQMEVALSKLQSQTNSLTSLLGTG